MYLTHQGMQSTPPQNMPLWHNDYFELRSIEKRQVCTHTHTKSSALLLFTRMDRTIRFLVDSLSPKTIPDPYQPKDSTRRIYLANHTIPYLPLISPMYLLSYNLLFLVAQSPFPLSCHPSTKLFFG